MGYASLENMASESGADAVSGLPVDTPPQFIHGIAER
jgi:hypothetical protein